jgi:hypothetical protein
MSFSPNTAWGRDSRPHAWTDWYRFARDELGLDHDERVEYANHRFVEEQNRESLRHSRETETSPNHAVER